MDNIQNHLRSLVQMAITDQSFDERERALIYSIGKANRIAESEIDALVNDVMQKKGEYKISFSALSFDEKFEYLYNIIQMMKIDNQVFLSEIKFCKGMAKKLGFDEKVVSKMSSKIYSDPSITSDIDALKRAVKKFEM